MSNKIMAQPFELTDAELDAVSGGANGNAGSAAFGLVAVAAAVGANVQNVANNVDVLSHNNTALSVFVPVII